MFSSSGISISHDDVDVTISIPAFGCESFVGSLASQLAACTLWSLHLALQLQDEAQSRSLESEER